MMAGINNLTIETEGTEEEAAEQLTSALEMEEEEGRYSEGTEGGMGLIGRWEPQSSSLRMQSRAELRLLMPVMGSTS